MPDATPQPLKPDDALTVRRLMAAKMFNIAAHYYAGAMGCPVPDGHRWVAETSAVMQNGQTLPGQLR